MSKHLRTLLILVTFVLFLGVISFTYNTLADKSTNLQANTNPLPAVDFMVINEGGEKVMLSDYYGKPILLNFWATWCPYCVEGMPDFQKAYEEYGDEIQFLMVNSTDGQRETLGMATSFIEENGYTIPVCFDIAGEATVAYGASVLPLTVGIDENQNVIIYHSGRLSEEMVDKAVKMLLPIE